MAIADSAFTNDDWKSILYLSSPNNDFAEFRMSTDSFFSSLSLTTVKFCTGSSTGGLRWSRALTEMLPLMCSRAR